MKIEDAKKSLEIYQKFTEQSKRVIEYFEIGRKIERDMQVELPRLQLVKIS